MAGGGDDIELGTVRSLCEGCMSEVEDGVDDCEDESCGCLNAGCTREDAFGVDETGTPRGRGGSGIVVVLGIMAGGVIGGGGGRALSTEIKDAPDVDRFDGWRAASSIGLTLLLGGVLVRVPLTRDLCASFVGMTFDSRRLRVWLDCTDEASEELPSLLLTDEDDCFVYRAGARGGSISPPLIDWC